MRINNLNIFRSIFGPTETDAVFVIGSNTMLPFPVRL